MQLDGRLIEQLTGQPYNPKQEYPPEVVLKALKTFEVRGGNVRALSFEDLRNMLQGKTVAVFNDTMRQALQMLIPDAYFVKTCSNNCIEINPLGNKPGVRISFPGTVGQLDATQMAELIKSGRARIYYAEIEAVEVPPCLN
jgi:acetylglutamate kinase